MPGLTVDRPLHLLEVCLLVAVLGLTTHDPVRAQPDVRRVKVATTTSLYDTGLWDVLEAAFEKAAACELDIINAGTGRALAWGASGDVDVVVTHSPTQEAAFIAAGHGRGRVPFAYNHYLIVGPATDPADIGECTPADAFRTLHRLAQYPFVSRGDDSGTHVREKSIWQAAGLAHGEVRDSGPWYVEAGLGMGPTLSMAAQIGAYTLTDNGTFLAYRGGLDLVPIVAQGEALLNVYAVIVCTRAANPDGAAALAAFLASDAGQELIGDFGRETHGTSLFEPCAGTDCGGGPPR
jgi:tungstate transport system substrate-binding protein